MTFQVTHANGGKFGSVEIISSAMNENAMRRDKLTEKILDIKRSKRWSWRYVAQAVDQSVRDVATIEVR